VVHILIVKNDYFLNGIKQLIFVVQKHHLLCEVGSKFLNIIYTNFSLEKLSVLALFVVIVDTWMYITITTSAIINTTTNITSTVYLI
jgi:hypothetical protein